MKKIGVLLILLLVLFSFSLISAQDDDMPGAPGGEDIDKTKELAEKGIDVVPLDPETGGIDEDKLNLGKSKAEERIEKIDDWLEEYASWLKLVFGMVPEVSVHFFINMYFLLWGFVMLVLNAKRNLYFRFLSIKAGGYNLSMLFGFIIFILLFIVLRVNVFFANFYYYSWEWANDKWYGQVIRVVALVASTYVIYHLVKMWLKRNEKKQEKEDKEEEAVNRRALKKLVGG